MGMTLNMGKMSYRSKVIFILVGLIISISSLLYTNHLTKTLKDKEQAEIHLWSYAWSKIGDPEGFSDQALNSFSSGEYQLMLEILDGNQTIPFIITDEDLNPKAAKNVDEKILNDPKRLRRELESMSTTNPYIDLMLADDHLYLFYGESTLLRTLYYFPYIQLGVIAIFIGFAFIAFRSSKHDEQNRVWIGLAKETAHQLGTPTSSLLGWIEYLRSQNVEQFVVEEMDKDLTRLLKVVDRFSKIGSTTSLEPKNIHEIVSNSVEYFRKRLPKNVELIYDSAASEPLQAMVNDVLFEWIVENLMKNALDAMQGHGTLTVNVFAKEKWLYIDVKDTGKGITRANFKRIFDPGFTTKTRGWGLGLSLSKRVIEDYHNGKIFVQESEIDKGTTIRIMVNKL